ncbi:MAG: hypothetical protein KBD76_15270, partial [Bacteriovorax sp.]|nr:hypothetical protein [Bacteriovorax sp.]
TVQISAWARPIQQKIKRPINDFIMFFLQEKLIHLTHGLTNPLRFINLSLVKKLKKGRLAALCKTLRKKNRNVDSLWH